MSIFDRILFVANGADAEQHALTQAAALAEASGADVLTIMDVRPPATSEHGDAGQGQGYSVSQAPVRPLKGRSRVKIESGRSLKDVLEAAGDYDLVVKAAARPRRIPKGPGYEDRALLRECPCPIWLARPPRQRLRTRILAAIEFFDDPQLETALATEVMAHAAAAAEADNAKVELVHAWQIRHELELRQRMNVTSLLADVEAAHRRHLGRLLDGWATRPAERHLINGPAGVVIPALAERRHVDLVVVPNTRRSRLARAFGASPAERLLARLECSVLVVNQRARGEKPVEPSRDALDSPPQRVARSAHG